VTDDNGVTLTPVNYNPFAISLTPVDRDPFADEAAYAKSLATAPQPVPVERGGFLPLSRYSDGSVYFDSDAGIVGAVKSAFTLPHDVATGQVDPGSDEAVARSFGMAGLMGLGNAPRALMGAAEGLNAADSLASKSARMHSLQTIDQRPISADYPNGAPVDAVGNITHDPEGRPLGAQFVVGRNVVGQGEKALSPEEFDAVATQITGNKPALVAASRIGGDAGQYRVVPGPDGPIRQIYVNKALSKPQADTVLGHETGHAIDDMGGAIPSSGLNEQLRNVYDAQNNQQSHGRQFGPEQAGYSGKQVAPELWAEAIRAYATSPNSMKAMAPDVAAKIRAAVNANPRLSRTIQFNANGVPLTLTPVNGDPFSESKQQ
jgi:hypothetical protein